MSYQNPPVSLARRPPAARGQRLRLVELEGHEGRINACVSITGRSDRFLTASSDGLLCEWFASDLDALEESRQPRSAHYTWQQEPASPVLCCAYAEDGCGEFMASTHADNTIRIWRLARRDGGRIGVGQHVQTITPTLSPVSLQPYASACCFSPNNNSILTGMTDGFLLKRSVLTGECEALITQHPSAVIACGYTRNGENIVSVSSDGTLKIQDNRRIVNTFRYGDEIPTLASLSTNSNKVLIATRQGRLTLCDLATANIETEVWDCGIRDLICCQLSQDGNEILLVDRTNGIHVLYLPTREISSLLRDASGQITTCTFIQANKIALGYEDGTIKLRYRTPHRPNLPLGALPPDLVVRSQHGLSMLRRRAREAPSVIAYNGDEIPHIGFIVDPEVAQRRPEYPASPAAVAAAQPAPSTFQGEELDAESECPVCMELYSGAEHFAIILTTCKHAIGSSCLHTLRQAPGLAGTRCPICRTPLPPR